MKNILSVTFFDRNMDEKSVGYLDAIRLSS